jgi:hypothetical protein
MVPLKQYESKITDFIQAHDFQTTKRDPIKFFQSQVRKVINNGKALIPPERK